MNLSTCGLVCDECPSFGNECNGCRAIKGQTFWALEMMPNKTCPLYHCAVNERGLTDCGACAELPCKTFLEMKDPSSTDEEHRQAIIDRVAQLKNSAGECFS